MNPRPAGAVTLLVLVVTWFAGAPADVAAGPTGKLSRIGLIAPGSPPGPGRGR